MFEVKVKTLDGRNTSFSVEDEITVAEFKAKISESVSIEASRQRLIFTGKVLQDNNKLKSYNVEDKVIHVVNRSPPTVSNASSSASAASATTAGSRGNANRPSVSMSTVPSNMLGDVMNSVMSGLPGEAMVHHIDMRRANNPQGASHTESGRRVVLIRQWLRDCHSLLDRIRNPSQGTRLSSDSQTGEARAASLVFPQVHGEAISVSVTTSNVPRPAAAGNGQTNATATGQSQSSTRTSSATASTQSATGQSPAGSDTRRRPAPTGSENALPPINPHVEVLNSLWGEVDALQVRLHPHMHRYRDLLGNPGSGCIGHNQHLFNTIASVTHNLSHIYHALSDLNCAFRPDSSFELTAPAAPAPPPTAIIQQTIPVTIPLRATLNVSPRTARRQQANPTSTTSSTGTSSAARPTATSQAPSGQGSQSTATSTAGSRGVYANIELDMETDSGEDISDDGQHPPARSAAGTQPPSAPAADQLRNFNLSQIIQDAFSGIAGLGGAAMGGPPPASTAASASTAATSSTAAASTNSTPIAAAIPSGTFGQFIPPAGSATPSNGPAPSLGGQRIAEAMETELGAAGLPPGFPINSSQFAPRDRIDPYLSICASRHWMSPPPTSHTHSHEPSTNNSRSSTRQPTNTQVLSGTPAPSAGSQSRATTATTTRNTTTSSSTRQNSASAQNTSPPSASEASASTTTDTSVTVKSPASEAADSAERRRFFHELREHLLVAIRQVDSASNDTERLIQRMEDLFHRTATGHRPHVSVAELDRILGESSTEATPTSSSSELLEELYTLLFKDLSLSDVFKAYMEEGSDFDRLRGPLRRFARSDVLQDGPHTQENLRAVVNRLTAPLRQHIHQFLARQTNLSRSSYDVEVSIFSYITSWVLDILNFMITSKDGTTNYGQQLLGRVHQGIASFLRLLYEMYGECCTNSQECIALASRTFSQIIEHCISSRQVLGEALTRFATNHLENDRYVRCVRRIPVSSLSCHLIRKSEAMHTEPVSTQNVGSESPGNVTSTPFTTSTLSEASAADWRTVIPADWVAIIEEDIKRQLRLESNGEELPPLSDAYLNGRPQKRRRLSETDDQE